MNALPSHPNKALSGWHFASGVPSPSLHYRFLRRVCQLLAASLWKVRVFNRHHEPQAGSALYICNHQSLLDPPLMSLALRRPMNFMARDSLFRNPMFRGLITSLNAFPVKRGSADTGALKEAMRRLRAGAQLVVFPEGTRTHDGRIGPFLPGVSLLARRAADHVVPVVIDGAFEAWPRSKALPGLGRIAIAYGLPLDRHDLKSLRGEALLATVRERMIATQAKLRRRLGRPALPAPEL